MKLSSRARHAVRLALEISRHGGSATPVQLSEVARVTGLSKKFLEQLAMALKSHSILKGIAGRGGGYLLARPADEITIGQVLTSVIGPIQLTDCIEESSVCLSGEFCECRLVWLLLRERINELLDEYTISDLTDGDWLCAMREQLRAVDRFQGKGTVAAG